MGLLSHIEEANYDSKELASSITFKDFYDKYNISSFGIFHKKDGYYVLSNSFGIDIKTIVNLKFEESFFSELIIFEKKAYSYKKYDLSIQKINEAFSSTFKDNCDNVILYKVKDFILALFCNEDFTFTQETEAVLKNLSNFIKSNSINNVPENIDFNTEYFKYKISFKTAIEQSLANYSNGTDFSDCLFNQLVLNLSLYFPTPNFIKELSDKSIEIYIKAKTNIPAELLKIQLQNNLKNLLNDSVDYIELL